MTPPAPPPPSPPDPTADLAVRVAELERLLGQVLARARAHPAGRRILTLLGLS